MRAFDGHLLGWNHDSLTMTRFKHGLFCPHFFRNMVWLWFDSFLEKNDLVMVVSSTFLLIDQVSAYSWQASSWEMEIEIDGNPQQPLPGTSMDHGFERHIDLLKWLRVTDWNDRQNWLGYLFPNGRTLQDNFNADLSIYDGYRAQKEFTNKMINLRYVISDDNCSIFPFRAPKRSILVFDTRNTTKTVIAWLHFSIYPTGPAIPEETKGYEAN